ncbi:MAG: hypothetical protein HY782_24590 [Chloroflexi bacterium]|nr:hypothetical protein [Chloroflexota bacterium]
MDARTVQRLLEKLQALAESAEHLGAKSVEGMQREPRLSDDAKRRLTPLYREHALRLMLLYSQLGSAICDTVRDEAENNTARGILDLFHGNFAAMAERAREKLRREFGDNPKL